MKNYYENYYLQGELYNCKEIWNIKLKVTIITKTISKGRPFKNMLNQKRIE